MEKHHESSQKYVTGLVLSLILTLIPLWLTVQHALSMTVLIGIGVGLAVVQLFIQLFLFMHVTEKTDNGPSYHGLALILGLVVVITIVGGSVWIMSFNSQVQ